MLSSYQFCYLNDGYKFRVKNVERKIRELKYQIEKYGITTFFFLDNDVIGGDLSQFNLFLDNLIMLREEYNNFEIVLAEVITKNINYETIKKMALAGFSKLQIGYESPSDELLKKINKKNSFASNLLFIKWAKHFSIQINGLYVIRGLLEKTDDNVIESIANLYFMRFFLEENYFEHSMSNLSIMKSSRYFNKIKDAYNDWIVNPLHELLPKSYIKDVNRFDIFQFTKANYNPLWVHFEEMEDYLKKGLYEYELIFDDSKINYREIYNKALINELDFDDSLHWNILKYANYEVVAFEDIQKGLNLSSEKSNDLYFAIDSLKKEGLLYANKDYNEIVSIINTDLLQS